MNSKKSNGHRPDQAEQMLISYAGAAMDTDQSEDSEPVQPLDLPATKLRRPRSRKRSGQKIRSSSLWNVCQIFFIVFILATTVCVVWFTLILKSSMESMKTRITQLESFDRSTSKEYAELEKNLDGQIDKLQHNQDGIAALDKEHYLSVLRQLAFLNRTVVYLNEKVKSPQSATKINQDIELLKNGMADINQEITQVKDQVAQLKQLAISQNRDIADLRDKIWNLTAQVVHLTGKPMPPSPPKVTSTPPLILRVPIQSDMSGKEQSTSEIFKNLTERFALEIGHVRGYITSINSSLALKIGHLETKMKGLVKNIRDHMVQVDELSKEVESLKTLETFNNNKTDGGHFPVKVEHNKEAETGNFSVALTRMVQKLEAHDQKLSVLISQVTLMNHSIHHQDVSLNSGEGKQKAVSCNCSGVFKEVKKMLDADEKKLDSVRTELDQLKQAAVKGEESKSAATLPPTSSPTSESVSLATKKASGTVKMHEKSELEEKGLEGEIPTSIPTQITLKDVVERATGGGSTEAVPQNSTGNAQNVNEESTNAPQNTTVVSALGAESTKPPPTSPTAESVAETDEAGLEDLETS